MQGAYYLAMLIGVAWLCIWSIVPEPYRSRAWWPFDMRGEADSAPGSDDDGRRRPAGAAAPAADLQHALPEPRSAQSWRLRREQAQASRRQR
mgnify:CR=1 FL=1